MSAGEGLDAALFEYLLRLGDTDVVLAFLCPLYTFSPAYMISYLIMIYRSSSSTVSLFFFF